MPGVLRVTFYYGDSPFPHKKVFDYAPPQAMPFDDFIQMAKEHFLDFARHEGIDINGLEFFRTNEHF